MSTGQELGTKNSRFAGMDGGRAKQRFGLGTKECCQPKENWKNDEFLLMLSLYFSKHFNERILQPGKRSNGRLCQQDLV